MAMHRGENAVHIVICDDEWRWIVQAKAAVRRWSKASGEEACVTCFSEGRELLAFLAATPGIAFILLDIAFGEQQLEGIAIARRIRLESQNLPIIFFSSYPQAACEGYLVEADGFLLKPIEYPRLVFFIERALKKRPSQDARAYPVVTPKYTTVVRYADIVYAEARNHDVYLYTQADTHRMRKTLKMLLDELGCEDFLQIHKAYMVARHRILNIAKRPPIIEVFTGVHNIRLPLGRAYAENVQQSYINDALRRLS